MPTRTPTAVLAAGAGFQATDELGAKLARIGLLWKSNGVTYTLAQLTSGAASLQKLDDAQLLQCKTVVLWAGSGVGGRAADVMAAAVAYQGAGPAQLDLCETISEWLANGGGSVSSTVAIGAPLQGMSPRQLMEVEVFLLSEIYASSAPDPASLLSTAVTYNFAKYTAYELSVMNAYLYCYLS